MVRSSNTLSGSVTTATVDAHLVSSTIASRCLRLATLHTVLMPRVVSSTHIPGNCARHGTASSPGVGRRHRVLRHRTPMKHVLLHARLRWRAIHGMAALTVVEAACGRG